jgi:signal transduction histidine kinase
VTSTTLGKTRRTVLSFTAILVVFLVVADGLVITQQTNLLRTEMTAHAKYEFDLFGKLVAGSLTKGDYVAVEEAVFRWGRERQNILELNITAANGFTIASYKRDNSATESRRFQGKLEFGIDNIATITMVKDMSAVSAAISKLAYQLVAFSIVLVAFLGFLLQRIAVRPLQKEIIEHEQTEEKLHLQAVELRESNKELESYSYAIAHDLRAPLRSVTGFSQVLMEDAIEKLNADEKDYLQRVIKAGKYMAQLIDDILELARITRSEFKPGVVDLSSLAHAAVERLCESGLVRDVACNIQDGLAATGDFKLLALVLENLLGNACKYTSKTENARIEFGAKEKDGETVYFVTDNGVGFDMKYADKLFKSFQRLHNLEEFEGTGIGLAIVARIIHRHGGRVWAEGEMGKGATFYFTLA